MHCRDVKCNNDRRRSHTRSLDRMDLLAMYQPPGSAPLDELAKLGGFPGKLGMDGSAVWSAWLAGDIANIRDYCETDVVNTYLVFLRYQLMRGALNRDEYAAEITLIRNTLTALPAAHWRVFMDAWPGEAP